MKMFILVATVFLSVNAWANHCDKYANQSEVVTALQVLAKDLKYSMEQMCTNSRIGDIYAVKKVLYTRQGEPIPHIWVNLHYWSYTCQYYIRESDHTITKANCYNGT